jgi:hypothetical protein
MHMNHRKFYSPFEPEKKRLGELLLSSYYLSEEELDELLEEQKIKPGRRLGYLCIEKGYAKPTEVMDALLRQLPVSVPYTSKMR